MTIKSKLSILPYFVIGSIVYFQFLLQKSYDQKLERKLDQFNTTQLHQVLDKKEVTGTWSKYVLESLNPSASIDYTIDDSLTTLSLETKGIWSIRATFRPLTLLIL